jgi:hypothetical protein
MRRHFAFLRRGSLVRLDAVSPTLILLDHLRLDERALLRKALIEIGGAAPTPRVSSALARMPMQPLRDLPSRDPSLRVVGVPTCTIPRLVTSRAPPSTSTTSESRRARSISRPTGQRRRAGGSSASISKPCAKYRASPRCSLRPTSPGATTSVLGWATIRCSPPTQSNSTARWCSRWSPRRATSPAAPRRASRQGRDRHSRRGRHADPRFDPASERAAAHRCPHARPAQRRGHRRGAKDGLRVRPADFRVALFHGPNREATIYRSKAIGEPPLMLAISVFAAIADAIHSLAPGSRYGSTPPRPRNRSCMR